MPDNVVTRLLDEVASGLAGREDCPSMTITRTDGDQHWQAGPDGQAEEVRAPGSVLLGWLLGREPIEGAPAAPRWL